MPKLRKPPRNPYYFFMLDRKAALEARGYRFPGGMPQVAHTVREEWNTMKPRDRAYFDELARIEREKDRDNFHNKFTVTGESFAHVVQRQNSDQERLTNMDRIVDELTINSKSQPEATNFIVIRAIYSCEVVGPHRGFWPLEICIAAFNLKDGMKCNYWTLVDTVSVPIGYASATKDTSEETGLPQPGSYLFEEKHRDYRKILTNIKMFVERFLADYENKFVLFAMDGDMKSAEGCLWWLKEHAKLSRDEEAAMDKFFDNLMFYKLPKLLLRFAMLAKIRNPNYDHVMAKFNNLEQAAVQILRDGCFDYRGDITCDHHNKEEPSVKMQYCCRNMVLRRVYLILREIAPAMLLPMKEGHDIENFKAKSKVTSTQVSKPVPPPPYRICSAPPTGFSSKKPITHVAPAPEPPKFEFQDSSDFLLAAWGKPVRPIPGLDDN